MGAVGAKQLQRNQRIYRSEQMKKDIKKGFHAPQFKKLDLSWVVKPRFSWRDILIVAVLTLVIRYFATHLSISWR